MILSDPGIEEWAATRLGYTDRAQCVRPWRSSAISPSPDWRATAAVWPEPVEADSLFPTLKKIKKKKKNF